MNLTQRLVAAALASAAFALTGCGASSPRHTSYPSAQRLSGTASYYADSLSGNTTANGESYDPAQLTAAHRTLPFGARVAVRRVDTGRRVVVRINDRGPYAGSRIIDLSRAAAEALQMIRAGIVQVELEVLSLPASRTRRATR
jgi:rare lipoprotein A